MHIAARIIPCLLLSGRTFVKTVQFGERTYVGDPVNVLSIFNDFEVDEIVVLDIDGARSGRPTALDYLAHLTEECFIPFSYGGGIRGADDMGRLLRVGVEKVIVNSLLADDPAQVEEGVRRYGSQAIVASVDVRGSGSTARAFVHGGADDTGADAVAWARRAADLGVGEVLLTSIDREGTMSGYDLELIATVAAAVDVPVIAHGGAGKRRHLAEPIARAGAAASAAGSLFVFQGPHRGVLVNYPARAQIMALIGR